jgi:hypothetical protein
MSVHAAVLSVRIQGDRGLLRPRTPTAAGHAQYALVKHDRAGRMTDILEYWT